MKGENSVLSDTWKCKTAQSAEALKVLDLVETTARSMKNENEGMLTTHVDFKVAWEMLTDCTLKANQRAMDGGSISSKTLEIERKSKLKLEYVPVKTSKDDEEVNKSSGKLMVIKCDKKL